jgi:Ca-activated chloride channel family protein
MLDFHFIRPLWLLALIPSIAITVLLVRRKDSSRIWHGIIADHLLQHLVSGSPSRNKLQPHMLLGLAMIIMSLALAGPAWVREPSPFADDTASLVIAVEVTPTMLAQDVQPSRLERAAQKIKDLLEKRKGSKTALVAYAGSAHLVIPLTEDGDLIADFTAELDPAIMPAKGDAADQAVALAQSQLTSRGIAGSVLLVTDNVSPNALARIGKLQSDGGPRVHVYGIAAGNEAIVPPGSPPAPPLDRDNLKKTADAGQGSLVLVTPDATDVEQLSSIVETQFTEAVNPDGGDRWQDFGYWLMPFIAFLALWWFRQGWTIQWQPIILVFMLLLGNPDLFWASGAENSGNQLPGRFWFQTQDQKAQRLFQEEKFVQAAALFTTPSGKGAAWYRAGEFEKAAAAFGRTGTPEGMFNRGNALILLGNYEEAIRSYELTLKERPQWTAALENLELAKLRLAKLGPPDDAVSQKGMGKDDEPDEIVFDDRAKNKENANTETVSGTGEEMSDKALRALWLRRVETSPADFLRRKFAYQYHKRQTNE